MSDHYFSPNTATPSSPHSVALHLKDMAFDLMTDRGVFSNSQVDPGTRVLLTEAASPDGATSILDLGCGYGPVACAVATRAPQAAVYAIDVNERAVGLCRANAERLGLDQLTACMPDEVPPDAQFDLIVSNPPIRVGKKVLHPLLATWLDRLTPQGRADLVVHKHLGSDSLQKWLNEQGWPTTRLISRSGYRVLQVRPRPRVEA